MLEKIGVWMLFVFIMTLLCGSFYGDYEVRNQRYELMLKCMEQDTPINCAAAFETGEKK